MDELHLNYLNLLRDLTTSLDRLSQLAQQKITAVREDDLISLDEVLKQEQAMTLNLRGLEQKRLTLLTQLGLENISLAELPNRYPPQLQDEAQHVVDALRQSSDLYRSQADAARGTLELHLHQIEKVITSSGVDPASTAPGYSAPSVEPPNNMKTDFRA